MINALLQRIPELIKRCTFCLIVTFAVTSAVWAQTQISSGTIQGVISDQVGAVVPGASVEARNLGTNFTKTVSTDSEGRYVLLQLPPGRYTLTVSQQGFTSTTQEDFPLNVGQALSLNLSLQVTGVTGSVSVTAIPTVDTLKTESSSTINEAAINNTPILGRKFEDLLTLTPGVSVVQGPDGDEINFAGQRGVFNNVSLDGGDYNNGFFGEQVGGQRAAIDITLEAVQEFQVVATGAPAEFGRTAGGIINVVSKSGTNEFHGSAFYFQRLEALSANTSDGTPLTDFNRKQFGGVIGGPIKKDKMFFFLAYEQILEDLTRPGLSQQLGATPCPVPAPTILLNEGLINSNADCQRLALIGYYQTVLGSVEGAPLRRPIRNRAFFGKFDWMINTANKFSVSYNFDYSKNTNQTFDVATYGNSANGIEGPSKINVLNFNLFTTVSPTMVNEAHFTYGREERPREGATSPVFADTGIGFAPSFRFGDPFFLQPNVDELIWRTQVKDNFSIVRGPHTIKFGGDWLHTNNDQVFRGFFTGRYLFDSTTGFLRYSSAPALNGFGPTARQCFTPGGVSTGWITTAAPFSQICPGGSAVAGGPLLLYLQNGISSGRPDVPLPGASTISNEDLGLFIQDTWKIKPNFTLNFGLRWEAQIFPEPIVPPSETAYASLLTNPSFDSDGTLHSPKKQFQPRVGFAWDIGGKGKSVLRGSYGIYYGRQNMLSQVGSITDNGAQQFGIACASSFGCSIGGPPPTYPNTVPVLPGILPGASVRVFSKSYANPRIYTANAQFEQQVTSDMSIYFDFTHAQGVHMTRFLNYGRVPGLFPTLGDVFVTSANGKSLYNGFTVGARKRFSKHYQFEVNYVLAKDQDDDSNERDPFTDRSFDITNLSLDWALSDRDIRHKFNFVMYTELPWGLEFAPRIQARSAQPITPEPRTATNRNTLRKDNQYFSFDWRLERPFKFKERYALIPIFEMFNTFNNDNNVNPLTSPVLFNFDGYLRSGVGDPLQLQLALRFTF